MRRWIPLRLLLLVLVLTTSASSFTLLAPKVNAGSYYTKTFTVTTIDMWVVPTPSWYTIKQTASVTIFYNKGIVNSPHHVRVNWIDCQSSSVGIEVEVTWCGYTKRNALTIDFGFNFTKKALRIIGRQDCWARRLAQATYFYQDGRKLLWQERRQGCA